MVDFNTDDGAAELAEDTKVSDEAGALCSNGETDAGALVVEEAARVVEVIDTAAELGFDTEDVIDIATVEPVDVVAFTTARVDFEAEDEDEDEDVMLAAADALYTASLQEAPQV